MALFVDFNYKFFGRKSLQRSVTVAREIGYEVNCFFSTKKDQIFFERKWPRHARSVIPSHSSPQLCISHIISKSNSWTFSCWECLDVVFVQCTHSNSSSMFTSAFYAMMLFVEILSPIVKALASLAVCRQLSSFQHKITQFAQQLIKAIQGLSSFRRAPS